MIKGTIRSKEVRILLSLYTCKTSARPHVEYCVSASSPYYKKYEELREKVQRKFTKIIVNVDGLSYEERVNSLKLWSLEERRNSQDLTEVFNNKGTRGHSFKLAKLRCTHYCWKHFLPREAATLARSWGRNYELDDSIFVTDRILFNGPVPLWPCIQLFRAFQ